MAITNRTLVDFSGGEVSHRFWGRYDLQLYQKSCKRLENFIAETAGSARFRPGFVHVTHTRRNNFAVLIPYQFNDEQAYVLEFTAGYIRFYKDNAQITEDAQAFTSAPTLGAITTINMTGHGYSDGDEVFIEGVLGTTELNNSFYLVAGSAANSFRIQDQDGNEIVSSGYTAYVSGGTAAKVVEVESPYTEDELYNIQNSPTGDVLYLTHKNHEPRKLTRSSHSSWTLAVYDRTADPFSQAITGITSLNPAVLTYSGDDNFSNGDLVLIDAVVSAGTYTINDMVYRVANVNTGANTFELTDKDTGANIDLSGGGVFTYTSGGHVSLYQQMPNSVVFHQGRLIFSVGDTIYMSRAPLDDGTPRYDDFTTGTDDDHALIFSLPSERNNVDVIQWLATNRRYLLAGTYSRIVRITGSSTDAAITPTSVISRGFESFGCANIHPIAFEGAILYLERNSININSFEFDIIQDDFTAIDRTFTADHITRPSIVQLSFQNSRPDLLWAVRSDGELIGLTYKRKEDISGWHRHSIGNSGICLSVAQMRRVNNYDQVWAVNEYVVNGVTRRYVEYMADEIIFKNFDDFYTGEDNSEEDKNTYTRYLLQKQKEYIHMDSALSLDTSEGITATLTPGAVTGTGITFTASANIFSSGDVGRELWKKAIDGVGYGIAEITAYVSPTEVTCTILSDFDSVDVISAGNWYLTTDTVRGLAHLEGQEVAVLTDGAVHPNQIVSGGSISLDYQSSVIHVGFIYTGVLITLNIEMGGATGSSQSKPKDVKKVNVRFYNTVGTKLGTSLYTLTAFIFREAIHWTDNPIPLFSGFKSLQYRDKWDKEKHVFIVQDVPIPCVIQGLDIFTETVNV